MNSGDKNTIVMNYLDLELELKLKFTRMTY